MTHRCDLVVLSALNGGFRDYVAVCPVHGWVSSEYGTDEAARRERCQFEIELEVAARRQLQLVERGFEPWPKWGRLAPHATSPKLPARCPDFQTNRLRDIAMNPDSRD